MSGISRRDFVKLTVGSIASSGLLSSCSFSENNKRPNILWISCEDISPHLGCYGNELAVTPNIDAFARESVRYTNAFTVAGVCAPSRSGIITGMYPTTLGSVNMRCVADKPDMIKCFPELLRNAGYYCSNNDKEDYNFEPSDSVWHESGRQAHWNKRPSGKPFFAVFNFRGTHESKLWSSSDFENTHPEGLEKSEYQDPGKFTVPPLYPDTLAVRKDLARLYETITTFDKYVKEKIDEVKKAGLYEDTVIFVWSDHGDGLPRAKRWLYDSGTLVPLIVRIPGRYRIADQSQPGSTDDQLINFIDLGPTVLNLAGLSRPNYMHGRAFLGPNLPQKREYIFGVRQRIDQHHDMVRSVRDQRYRYIRNFMPYLPYFCYNEYHQRCNTLRSMQQQYKQGNLDSIQSQWFEDSRPAEELYDLKSDPWETVNLAEAPEFSDIKARLKDVLKNWMADTLDTGLLPEPMMKSLAVEYGGEYMIFRKTGGKNRAQKLIELAFIASDPQKTDLRKVDAALRDSDPAARYWAVLAKRKLIFDYDKDVEKILDLGDDPSPSVRIAAAWSLNAVGKKQKSVELIENELKDFNQLGEVIHFALFVLEKFGPEAKSALDTVEKMQGHKWNSKYIRRLIKRIAEKY